MIYYIVPGQIFTVFLSLTHLTMVSFPEKITDYIGGKRGEFKVYEVSGGKGLVFEAKLKGVERNFIALSKTSRYHLGLSYSGRYVDKDIEIKSAVPCNYFTLLKETPEWQLFECPKSLFFVNKKNHPIVVNDLTIKDKSYLSKGPPVFVSKKLIYYRGILR